MQTIVWQETDLFAEEEIKCNGTRAGTMETEERNAHEAIQISKFLDPLKNDHRKSHIALLESFGAFLSNGHIQDIAKDLLTDDFEIFLFSSTGKTAVQNARGPQGFIDLFQNIQVKGRYVRETHVDVEKDTACQICNYRIMYPDNNFATDEVASEIFTIRDGRISKYRTCFATLNANGVTPDDLLEPTRKDIMLGKVKQINFAVAGRPNFAQIASLLDDTAEYKIWRWNDYKSFTFTKKDLASASQILEEFMTVKRVVPYDVSPDVQGRTVSVYYNYHLVDRITGKRHEWLSTCVYWFNKDLNIVKVSHQGELHSQGEVEIRFEVHTREKLEKKVKDFYSKVGATTDAFYGDNILYDCNFLTFSFAELPLPGSYQGLKQVDRLADARKKLAGMKQDFIQPVDMFLDVSSDGYDVVFAVVYSQGTLTANEHDEGGEKINAFALVRKSFENGRLAKSLEFLAPVRHPIESPFDDKTYCALNIE